ncbi:hypothetical protein D3C85_1025730 [compost metagenome]
MNEINRSVFAVCLNFAHRPANAMPIVRIIFGIETNGIKAQNQEYVFGGYIKTHPLVHHRIEIFSYIGAPFFCSAIRNTVNRKNYIGFGPGITIF